MTQWVRRGLRAGIRTTSYPAGLETAPGVTPGRPVQRAGPVVAADLVVSCCPVGALRASGRDVLVDLHRCVHCLRCARQPAPPVAWAMDYEWARPTGITADADDMGAAFHRSLHIMVVDAGDCGACLHEVKQLDNPYYNMHRLGFFITPTPRHADVLLVVGPVTDHMRVALQKTYDAMPSPKRVMAVGACALSGGVFGPSFVSGGGVADVLPVDVAVPGQPPPPLAILHGLLLLTGRAAAAPDTGVAIGRGP